MVHRCVCVLTLSTAVFALTAAGSAGQESDPPKAPAKTRIFNEDLRLVPEIAVGKPISRHLDRKQSVKQMGDIFAGINQLNQKKRDGFLESLIAQRTELQGVPFLMGDDCRMTEAQARIVPFLSATLNESLQNVKFGNLSFDDFFDRLAELQARPTLSVSKSNVKVRVSPENTDSYYRALVGTMIQVLAPEAESFRIRLARSLSTIPHVEATKALAQLAIFAPEKEVRATAIAGLKLRREKDYTPILMQGFQYPLPVVSQRAAEAVVKLERKDLCADLVDVLDRPDPRLPASNRVQGKEVAVVRELVKVNHHHNCALCHAPGNTPDVPEWALTAEAPLPSEPFPSQGGYMSVPRDKSLRTPEILVRIDMTYLRQDFSMMLPVSDPDPWPVMQRFDFFVRTRTLTEKEAQEWQASTGGEATRPSPYRQSALLALRELTGRDTQPTAQAWRDLLKLPAPSAVK